MAVFTGIIEEIGHVEKIETLPDAARIRVAASRVVSDASLGDSISVNGVCLTVTDFDDTGFTADVMQVTLDYTALRNLSEGASVNLERAMSAQDRFGGHVVQGHVDGTATVRERVPSENWEIFRFQLDDAELANYLVKKGSIAINGTSLTIAELADGLVEVSLIPATLEATMLGELQPGDKVNIECDVLAKYVRAMLDR